MWRTRGPGGSELKFQEIRRVSFFNRTSYKKKARINTKSNFAFIKILDETNVNVASANNVVEVEFLPGGFVSLDFGVYE